MWQISRTRGLHISANCLRKTPTQQCIALVVGRRRYRVVDWDRCVTLEWFRRIAHLHRSAIARLLSEHIWSSHLLFGRPGGCVQERSGRRPKEMSIWQWRAWCAGVSFQSLATWPNRLLRLLIIRSISGVATAQYAQLSLCYGYGRKIESREYASDISCGKIPGSWCSKQVDSTTPMHIVERIGRVFDRRAISCVVIAVYQSTPFEGRTKWRCKANAPSYISSAISIRRLNKDKIYEVIHRFNDIPIGHGFQSPDSVASDIHVSHDIISSNVVLTVLTL